MNTDPGSKFLLFLKVFEGYKTTLDLEGQPYHQESIRKSHFVSQPTESRDRMILRHGRKFTNSKVSIHVSLHYGIKALKTLVWHLLKGAFERNDYFEKIKKKVLYDEQVRTNKAKDYQSQGRTDLGMNSMVYHCANRTVERLKIFSIKKESFAIIDVQILFILLRCC